MFEIARVDPDRIDWGSGVWTKVAPEALSGCWLWMGVIHPSGYGQLHVGGGRYRAAHRVTYEAVFGPIPFGLYACHRCDVPCCVNPGHLFLGTHQDNMDDMNAKGRSRHPGHPPGKHPMARLSIQDVVAIREALARGHSREAIAVLYGVRPSTIMDIDLGRRWKSLPRNGEAT